MNPLVRQVLQLLTVVVFISVTNVPLVNAYCWEPGKNPSFTGRPIVQQVDPSTIRVTWEGLVQNENCIDNYLIKYWVKDKPQDYKMTDLIDKQSYTSDIIVISQVIYVFQVIARENKGGFVYNKSSDQIEFKTSAYNRNIKPTTLKPDQIDGRSIEGSSKSGNGIGGTRAKNIGNQEILNNFSKCSVVLNDVLQAISWISPICLPKPKSLGYH